MWKKQKLLDVGYNEEIAEYFKDASENKIYCLENYFHYGVLCDCGYVTDEDLEFIKKKEK